MTVKLIQLGDDGLACEGGVCAVPDKAGTAVAALPKLTLISFPTCPFVQRAAIALKERGVEFEVVYIDLANKPDWFLALSPLGKVPVLKVERDGQEPAILFESAVILEYLDETLPGARLYPEDALERARARAWIEYAGTVLGDLWKLGAAKTADDMDVALSALKARLAPVEAQVAGPLFEGERFSAVDVVYAPVFRQIDVIETVAPASLLDDLPKLDRWRAALASRPSVRDAVPADYAERYLGNLRRNGAMILNGR